MVYSYLLNYRRLLGCKTDSECIFGCQSLAREVLTDKILNGKSKKTGPGKLNILAMLYLEAMSGVDALDGRTVTEVSAQFALTQYICRTFLTSR